MLIRCKEGVSNLVWDIVTGDRMHGLSQDRAGLGGRRPPADGANMSDRRLRPARTADLTLVCIACWKLPIFFIKLK
ncbi:hypothetical protein EVAR_17495_1 [Eumeta japonica]|uniref:Uncharacterized protein n=1 Tax=Eumeta variegata TaxID=151549 RepID=A0A4C1ZHQ4_EUMVA|nr:hypothetical protein EVAR_17495_1 [Eumeta japonica]